MTWRSALEWGDRSFERERPSWPGRQEDRRDRGSKHLRPAGRPGPGEPSGLSEAPGPREPAGRRLRHRKKSGISPERQPRCPARGRFQHAVSKKLSSRCLRTSLQGGRRPDEGPQRGRLSVGQPGGPCGVWAGGDRRHPGSCCIPARDSQPSRRPAGGVLGNGRGSRPRGTRGDRCDGSSQCWRGIRPSGRSSTSLTQAANAAGTEVCKVAALGTWAVGGEGTPAFHSKRLKLCTCVSCLPVKCVTREAS